MPSEGVGYGQKAGDSVKVYAFGASSDEPVEVAHFDCLYAFQPFHSLFCKHLDVVVYGISDYEPCLVEHRLDFREHFAESRLVGHHLRRDFQFVGRRSPFQVAGRAEEPMVQLPVCDREDREFYDRDVVDEFSVETDVSVIRHGLRKVLSMQNTQKPSDGQTGLCVFGLSREIH